MLNPIKEKDMLALAAYQAQLREKPELRLLFFELTDQCNLNCRHCGSGCSGNNTTFLDVAVIRKVLHSVADAYDPGKIMVCLTGGEPLLHPGVLEIIRMSAELGFAVGATTNATLIDHVFARQLAAAGLDTVAVSIDGIGDVHDSFRMKKGAFDRAIYGIHALRQAGIEPQIITVVHKENLRTLEEMFRFIKNMGIYSWRLVNVEPIGRASKNKYLLLDAEELHDLLAFIRSKRYDTSNDMEVTYGCSHFVTYEYEREIRDFYFQCGAGLFVASIAANGDMIGCLDIERREDLVQGNAYRDDFVSVWEERYQVFRKNRAETSEKCSLCEYKAVCMGDSAHTWDFDRNEPNYCAAKMLLEGQK